MRIDCKGNSWPMSCEESFEKAVKLADPLSYVFLDGKVKSKITSKERQLGQYYVVSAIDHYYAREDYLILSNPIFEY